MAYKALYRTYRPQKFSEVIGQDHIVRTLQNALASGKISHAYLFSGPRGTGKTSVARIFAKALNCDQAPTSEPCGECVSCREIAESNNPDVVEIDAASNNGVDEIRDIRDKVKFLPAGSKYKIYIIDEVHMLSQGAFNALLKTLEEPPKHVIFILATTEPHKVLPTILSRCQRFDFKSLSVKEIASKIKDVTIEEGFKISDEAIIGIAEAAEGGMRDALSYLDQANSFTEDEITIDDVNNVTGNLNYDKIIELARYFEEKNINNALKTINDLVIMGKEINKIVSGMLQFYRDILLYKNIDTSMFSKYIFEKQEFKKLVNDIDANKIFYYVDILSDVQTKIKTSSTPNIYLDVAVIKMINASDGDLNIVKRVHELEEKINSQKFEAKETPEIQSSDSDKYITLEKRLNLVVNELSKLELHKLIERVSILEENQIDNKTLKDNIGDVTTILNNISGLQIDISKLKSQLENNIIENVPNFDSNLLVKFNQIEKELHEIKYQTTNSDYNKFEFDINQFKDKIASIESKVYKLMSGSLVNNNQNVKKTKSKINEGQIVLFSDEIVDLNEFDKDIKEKVDFDEQIKKNNDIISNIPQPQIISYNVKNEEDTNTDDTNISNSEELPIGNHHEENKDNLNPVFSLKDFEQDRTLKDENEYKGEPINDLKVSDFENKTEEKIVKVLKNNEEEIIESPYSQLVRKINQEKEDAIPKQNYLSIDQEKGKENETVKVNINEDTVQIPKYTQPKNLSNDEFSHYSVTVIERILHSSRTPDAREDKIRIVNLWKSLDKNVSQEQIDVAELLHEGQVVAVGDKEFILIYPNESLCNQVMKYKFKRESLKLLFDLLGNTYNYIALPENVWNEKRTEYINQYNIGIRQPKLTPINNPNLSVEKENQDYLSSQERIVNKAVKLFGENIVKVE